MTPQKNEHLKNMSQAEATNPQAETACQKHYLWSRGSNPALSSLKPKNRVFPQLLKYFLNIVVGHVSSSTL